MSNAIFRKHVKIEILNAGLIHVEQSMDDQFRTAPTLFAQPGESDFKDFTLEEDELGIYVKTDRFKLTYYHKYVGIRPGVFFVELPNGNRWNMDFEDPDNLGGTVDSLDGCNGPIPVKEGLLSRKGIYCVDNSRIPLVVDGEVVPRPERDQYYDFYLFCYGTDYQSALKSLAWLSGPVPMLPRFLMGSWYSRWYFYSSEDYRNIVREYREHGIPLDILVFDMEWHDRKAVDGSGWAGTLGWTGWTYNRELLPDAEQLLKELHEDDIHVAFNAHPHDGVRQHEIMYKDFMAELGEPADGRALPFDAGSKRYMDAYFKHTHTPREQEGVDVWWVDWQQDWLMPYVHGKRGVRHLPWLNRLYYQHMAQNGRRGISFSRWGGWGDQKYPIQFSGDTTAKWEVLEFEVPFTATAGNCGCFYWSHDMGGFCGERNGELYARWLQFGAVSTTMRLHSAGEEVDRRPWRWDPEIYESLKHSFELRGQLMPYVYTMMYHAHRDAMPLVRPLYLLDGDKEESYTNPQEYFFGDHLLAAPIASPGVGDNKTAFQRVTIPEGTFYNVFTGERLTKGEYLVAANLNEFPLYVRAGVPIPLGKMGKRLTNLQMEITIQIFPAEGDFEFELYDDDGITENGPSARTVIRYSQRGRERRVTVEQPEGDFAPELKARTYKVRLRNLKEVPEFDIKPGETKTVTAEEIPQEEIKKQARKERQAGLSEEDLRKLDGCGTLQFHDSMDQKHLVRRFYAGEQVPCRLTLEEPGKFTAAYELTQPNATVELPLNGKVTIA